MGCGSSTAIAAADQQEIQPASLQREQHDPDPIPTSLRISPAAVAPLPASAAPMPAAPLPAAARPLRLVLSLKHDPMCECIRFQSRSLGHSIEESITGWSIHEPAASLFNEYGQVIASDYRLVLLLAEAPGSSSTTGKLQDEQVDTIRQLAVL